MLDFGVLPFGLLNQAGKLRLEELGRHVQKGAGLSNFPTIFTFLSHELQMIHHGSQQTCQAELSSCPSSAVSYLVVSLLSRVVRSSSSIRWSEVN